MLMSEITIQACLPLTGSFPPGFDLGFVMIVKFEAPGVSLDHRTLGNVRRILAQRDTSGGGGSACLRVALWR